MDLLKRGLGMLSIFGTSEGAGVDQPGWITPPIASARVDYSRFTIDAAHLLRRVHAKSSRTGLELVARHSCVINILRVLFPVSIMPVNF